GNTATSTAALDRPSRVTTTRTVVRASSSTGTYTFSCSTPFRFAANCTGAAIPSSVTDTPAGVLTTPGASSTPAAKIVASDPATSPGAKLAAFTTPAALTRGAALPPIR